MFKFSAKGTQTPAPCTFSVATSENPLHAHLLSTFLWHAQVATCSLSAGGHLQFRRATCVSGTLETPCLPGPASAAHKDKEGGDSTTAVAPEREQGHQKYLDRCSSSEIRDTVRIKTSQLNFDSSVRAAAAFAPQTGRCVYRHCLLAMTTHVAGKVFVLWPANTTAHLSLSLCLSSQSQSHWGFCLKFWCRLFCISPGRHSACKLPELSFLLSVHSFLLLFCSLSSFISH